MASEQPHVPSCSTTSLQSPGVEEADAVLREVQCLFRRTLASWASDLLLLRAAHQRTPRWVAAGDADSSSEVSWGKAA